MDLSIRTARLADVPRLLSLYKLLEVLPEPVVPIESAQARFRDLVSNPLHRLYVAELDQQIVGTFSMIFVPGISHSARDSCVVEDVVVESKKQGTGVGRQMMRFAMATCAARDCYKMVLSSHVDRERAHRFYESLGFRKHGYSYLIDLSDARAGDS